MNQPTNDFWGYFGFGLMVFLICSGVGSCNYQFALGGAARDAARHDVKP